MRGRKTQEKQQFGNQLTAKRLMAYSAAAGTGAFAFGGAAPSSDAAITVVDPIDFGVQGASAGWVSETPQPYGGQSFGIDILQNGGALEVGFFQGGGYGGYLIGRTDVVGYRTPYGTIFGSGQLGLLSNDTELPDTGSSPGGGKQALQGFLAGQIIGDGNDVDALDPGENVLRDAYAGGDWEAGNGVPSYIGFKIDIDNNASFDGFGWIEVIVDDPGSLPTITVTRWAYTDDGSPIAAGEVPEPGTLALLAAGAGALAIRRREDA